MRKTFWYIVGGQLATIAIPAFAQDAVAEPASEGVAQPQLTAQQQAQFDLWPADRQASYSAWPPEMQAYLWMLPPERQDVFWMLRDEDKTALVALDDAGCEAAWMEIERRLETMSSPEPATGYSETTDDEMAEEPSPVEPDDDYAVEPDGR